MGRKKVVVSAEEQQARRERWFGDDRNKRRRERYASDPEYRRRAIESARKQQRKRLSSEWVNCEENYPLVEGMGSMQKVLLPGGRVANMLTYSEQTMARLLGKVREGRNPGKSLSPWIRGGKWPEPVYRLLKVNGEPSSFRVYLEKEVRALMHVFSEHQRDTPYYHEAHVETRNKLFAAVAQARAEIERPRTRMEEQHEQHQRAA